MERTFNKIKSYSYTYNEENKEMTVYITDLNGTEKSVATISGVNKKNCDKFALEILDDLGYDFEG